MGTTNFKLHLFISTRASSKASSLSTVTNAVILAGLFRSLLISTVIREELVGPDQVCQSSDNSAINESLSASEVKVFTFSLLMVVILSSFLLVPRVANSAMLHAVVSDVAHVLAVLHAPKFLADTVTS